VFYQEGTGTGIEQDISLLDQNWSAGGSRRVACVENATSKPLGFLQSPGGTYIPLA
jgi:hypothetical protein